MLTESCPGGKATEEELEATNEVVDLFISRFPQFVRTPRNRSNLMAELHRTGQPITDYNALVRAYENCVARGELIISLKPFGIDQQVSGYSLKTHRLLDKVMRPIVKISYLDELSASEFKTLTDKQNRDAGRIERTPRALADMEKMFTAWFDANPGYGVFENQTREDVKRLIFEHLDSEEIPYSTSAVVTAAEYLHAQGKLFRDSDAKFNGTSGEFHYNGTRLVIHPQKVNPVLNPPEQQIEIVERTKKITLQDLRRMSSQEYAEALRNSTLAPQIESLLADH